MAINSIYKFIKERPLKEELHHEGLQFLGNAYGYDLYNATTFEGAEQLKVGNTDRTAGAAWTNNPETFAANINDRTKIYFFTKENTDKVFLACIFMNGGNFKLQFNNRFAMDINYNFQNTFARNSLFDNSELLLVPLFLLPNLTYNGENGLIIKNNSILGSYKGLLDPNHLPEQVIIENIYNISSYAFTDYPVEKIVISDTVEYIEPNAFDGYNGTIECLAESLEDTSWDPNWLGRSTSDVIWGSVLGPEGDAIRFEALKRRENTKLRLRLSQAKNLYRDAEYEQFKTIVDETLYKINECSSADEISNILSEFEEAVSNLKLEATYEEEERLEAERIEREFQTSDAVNVLRYKQEGKEIVILGCKFGRKKLSIPETINNKPVTKIDKFAFFENVALEEVELPPTIKYIGKGAFLGCVNASIKYPRTAICYSDSFKDVARVEKY